MESSSWALNQTQLLCLKANNLFDQADVTFETVDGSYECGLSTEMILTSYTSLVAKDFEIDEDKSE